MPEQAIPAEVTPDVSALVEQAQSSALEVRQFSIATTEDYQAADTALRTLKERKKVVKEKWDYLAEPHKEAERRLREFFKPVIDDTDAAIKACDQTMTGYRDLQRKLAEEERKRLEEIANRERARLEAQAATERAEAERKAREKQEKADALELAGKAGQAAKARAQAESLVEAAETKAADLESVAASVPAPIVQANIPKIAGSFGRKVWKARPKQSAVDHPNGQRKLTSTEVLILAAAEDIATGGQMNLALLLNPDMPGLNKRATALREHFNIAGFEAFAEESTVSRTRR